MGLRHWTGYVGFEIGALKNFLGLITDFCFGCHVPSEVGGCDKCGIGKGIKMCHYYLLQAEDYKHPTKRNPLIVKMQSILPEIIWGEGAVIFYQDSLYHAYGGTHPKLSREWKILHNILRLLQKELKELLGDTTRTITWYERKMELARAQHTIHEEIKALRKD